MTQKTIAEVVDQMTLEEQVSLLSGATYWRTAEIARLGVPAIKVTDGTNGARGEQFRDGAKTAAYPAEVALAATWNTDLVEAIGVDMASEIKAKRAHVLLAPAVNMHRNPLNGRNFECFSEDPHLASRMAVSLIKGVQSQGLGTTIKHFVGNECEHERRSINSAIDEKTLREIYMPPFEAAVKEANVTCVMTSYNWLNGTHTSESVWLLNDVLRGEWGFDGVVMSDWIGNHTTVESITAGLDLEMPGPGAHRGAKLVEAVQQGRVDPACVRRAAMNIVALGRRLGVSFDDRLDDERAEDRAETRALIRQAAAESTVLLRNQSGLLPLTGEKLRRIAVIGPNAAVAVIHGGGSAQINAHYAVTPLAGLHDALPDTEITYEIGAGADRFIPPVQADVVIEYYNNLEFTGEPALRQMKSDTNLAWFGAVAPEVDHSAFSARVRCRYTAQVTGEHEIGLMSAGLSRLWMDGVEILEAWESWAKGESYFGHGSDERRCRIHLISGQSYDFVLEYICGDGIVTTLKAARFGIQAVSTRGSVDRACEIAMAADAVIIITGLNEEWETESEDRRTLSLPPGQDALIRAVAAANPHTIVVVQAGSPIAMPWAQEVGAILQNWYPGQECGNALADVILGLQEPSGRLPQVFPMNDAQIVDVTERPAKGGTVAYSEGDCIGQRRFDRLGMTPLYPFGHGLGFGDVEYLGARVVATTADTATIEVEVRNNAARETSEVVQVYALTEYTNGRKLMGFAKATIAANETARVHVTLYAKAIRSWDIEAGGWKPPAAEVRLAVGRSATDLRLHLTMA